MIRLSGLWGIQRFYRQGEEQEDVQCLRNRGGSHDRRHGVELFGLFAAGEAAHPLRRYGAEPLPLQAGVVPVLRLAGLPTDVHPPLLEFLCLRGYATKERLRKIEEAIYDLDDLGLVVIDGIRDLAHDINSPGEATDLITKLMQWTDERRIHIHTVLHLNKGDDNTRGHLGTELNNKAETVLQITKDDFDRDISSVAAMHIRDRDFEPFAFRINADALPEQVEDYQLRQTTAAKSFDYAEVCEAKHREALELLFSKADRVSYSSLIGRLQSSYAAIGHSFGINKAKQLKVFLENKRMIVKEDKFYRYNPDFHY